MPRRRPGPPAGSCSNGSGARGSSSARAWSSAWGRATWSRASSRLARALREVVLRVTVRDPRREAVERFCRELAPLVTSGPPGIAGYATGRPSPRAAFGYWPTLIPRSLVDAHVEVRRGTRLVAPGDRLMNAPERPDGPAGRPGPRPERRQGRPGEHRRRRQRPGLLCSPGRPPDRSGRRRATSGRWGSGRSVATSCRTSTRSTS